jgi:hypothetical protein
MMLDHKSKVNVTESYIRISPKIRLIFYNYAELIVAEKGADIWSTLRLFKGSLG